MNELRSTVGGIIDSCGKDISTQQLGSYSLVQLRDENVPLGLPLILFDDICFLFTEKDVFFFYQYFIILILKFCA